MNEDTNNPEPKKVTPALPPLQEPPSPSHLNNSPDEELKENLPPEPLENPSHFGSLFESLLKKPQSLAAHLHLDESKGQMNLIFAAITAVALLIFGITVGSFSMNDQLWASPLKILSGTIISALICFPSLYIFTCLTGTTARLRSIFSGLLAALALLGILLLGFAPVLWVFSQSTHSVGFMGFLVLASWLIALYFAVGFLYKLIKQTGTQKLGPVRVWSAIFLLVTLQMSTSLRPIIGSSDTHLTHKKKFFLQHWSETAGEEVLSED